MIRCNLAILLAEQNLKITKVSTDTKISRTTLTSLANNNSQGIQLDTINTLCKYLSVTPNDLISFVPFDIGVKRVSKIDDIEAELIVEFVVEEKSKITECSFVLQVDFSKESDGIVSEINILAYMWMEDGDNDVVNENQFIRRVFKQMPRTFLTDFQNAIIKDLVFDYQIAEKFNSLFEWSSDFQF